MDFHQEISVRYRHFIFLFFLIVAEFELYNSKRIISDVVAELELYNSRYNTCFIRKFLLGIDTLFFILILIVAELELYNSRREFQGYFLKEL